MDRASAVGGGAVSPPARSIPSTPNSQSSATRPSRPFSPSPPRDNIHTASRPPSLFLGAGPPTTPGLTGPGGFHIPPSPDTPDSGQTTPYDGMPRHEISEDLFGYGDREIRGRKTSSRIGRPGQVDRTPAIAEIASGRDSLSMVRSMSTGSLSSSSSDSPPLGSASILATLASEAEIPSISPSSSRHLSGRSTRYATPVPDDRSPLSPQSAHADRTSMSNPSGIPSSKSMPRLHQPTVVRSTSGKGVSFLPPPGHVVAASSSNIARSRVASASTSARSMSPAMGGGETERAARYHSFHGGTTTRPSLNTYFGGLGPPVSFTSAGPPVMAGPRTRDEQDEAAEDMLEKGVIEVEQGDTATEASGEEPVTPVTPYGISSRATPGSSHIRDTTTDSAITPSSPPIEIKSRDRAEEDLPSQTRITADSDRVTSMASTFDEEVDVQQHIARAGEILSAAAPHGIDDEAAAEGDHGDAQATDRSADPDNGGVTSTTGEVIDATQPDNTSTAPSISSFDGSLSASMMDAREHGDYPFDAEVSEEGEPAADSTGEDEEVPGEIVLGSTAMSADVQGSDSSESGGAPSAEESESGPSIDDVDEGVEEQEDGSDEYELFEPHILSEVEEGTEGGTGDSPAESAEAETSDALQQITPLTTTAPLPARMPIRSAIIDDNPADVADQYTARSDPEEDTSASGVAPTNRETARSAIISGPSTLPGEIDSDKAETSQGATQDKPEAEGDDSREVLNSSQSSEGSSLPRSVSRETILNEITDEDVEERTVSLVGSPAVPRTIRAQPAPGAVYVPPYRPRKVNPHRTYRLSPPSTTPPANGDIFAVTFIAGLSRQSRTDALSLTIPHIELYLAWSEPRDWLWLPARKYIPAGMDIRLVRPGQVVDDPAASWLTERQKRKDGFVRILIKEVVGRLPIVWRIAGWI